MTTKLSSVLRQTLLGVSSQTNQLLYAQPRANLVLEATDTTAGGEFFPQLSLKTDRAVNGAGGGISFNAQNAAPAFVPYASIAGEFNTRTVGAESGQLDFYVYAAGTPRLVSLRGDLLAIVPSSAGLFALGTASLPWGSVFLGNGTILGTVLADVSGSGSLTVGTVSNHTLSFISNNSVRLTLDGAGRGSLNASPNAQSILTVGGQHMNGSTTVRAIAALMTTPSTATGISASFYSAPATLAAAYTSSLAHYQAADATVGATSALQNQYGLYIGSMAAAVNNYGLYLNISGGTQAWAVYSPAGQSYLNGPLGLGVNTYPLPAVLSLSPTLLATAGSGVQCAAVTSGVALEVIGATNSSSWSGIKISDTASGLTKFQVRGDGVLLLGSNTQVNNAMATVGGRVSLTANTTFDLTGNTLAATVICTTAVSVGNGLNLQIISLMPVVTLAGTGVVSGVNANVTVTSSSANSLAFGGQNILQNAGAGASYGVSGQVIANVGHTGQMIGVYAYSQSQGSSGFIYGVQYQHYGKAQAAFSIIAGNAGDTLEFGVYIDSTNLLGQWAYVYDQRATSTAGFLRYTDSASTVRFKVDVNGDITMGGNGRRILGDCSSATQSHRLTIMNADAGQASYVQVAPSSGGAGSGVLVFGNPDLDNSAQLALLNDGSTRALISTDKTGSGTVLPLRMSAGGSVVSLSIEATTDILLGAGGRATTSTAGFPFIPTVAGLPTGTVPTRAGFASIVWNSTDKKFCVNDGAGWLSTAALT